MLSSAAIVLIVMAAGFPAAAGNAPRAAGNGEKSVDTVPSEIARGEVLLHDLDARTIAVRSFEARFEQVYVSPLDGGEIREKGTLTVKRPGRARFEYSEPEKKLALVTAAGDTWLYIPEDAQALHGSLAGREEPHLRFLLGRGGIAGQFEVVEAKIGSEAAVLRLHPAKPLPGIEAVLLTLTLGPLQVRSLSLEDSAGGRTEYIFSGIREGTDPPDSLFVFTPPEGVEVVEESGR